MEWNEFLTNTIPWLCSNFTLEWRGYCSRWTRCHLRPRPCKPCWMCSPRTRACNPCSRTSADSSTRKWRRTADACRCCAPLSGQVHLSCKSTDFTSYFVRGKITWPVCMQMYCKAVKEFRSAFGVSLAATSAGRFHLCGRGEAVWFTIRGQVTPLHEKRLYFAYIWLLRYYFFS